MRLLLAGGGTGGHLFPAVALAEELMGQNPEAKVHFVGTGRGLEARLLPRLGWPLTLIDIQGLAGTAWGAKLALVPKMIKSLWQARRILKEFQPDVVVGVGGYASAPVLLACRWLGIPFVIHEQNAQPGMTNRWLGRWARGICLSMPGSDRLFPQDRVHLTGNPLRKGMEACPEELPQAKCLLVFGGSQGAQAINQAMVQVLPLLKSLQGELRIVHQTGPKEADQVRAAYQDAGWDDAEVVPFIEDMVAAYADAQLVVCRAGATTLAELTVCGRPAILVPFPFAAADHQTENARALEDKGAARLLPQKDLTPQQLAATVTELLQDRAQLQQMARASRSLGKRGAAGAILDVCRRVAGKAG